MRLSVILNALYCSMRSPRHSERSPRSEESLFSWVLEAEGFIASLGMTGMNYSGRR